MNERHSNTTCGLGLALAASLAALLAAPPAAAVGFWFENFDTYNTNQNLPSQSTWESWGNDPNAANFFAVTVPNPVFSMPNSCEINGPDDAVHRYRGYTIGKWMYSAWVWVPATMNEIQYFILVNTYPAVNSQDWSLQIELDGGAGSVNDFNSGASVPMVKGAWTEIRVVIDFDRDSQSAYYNNRHLVTKSWSGGVAAGGAVNLAAVDLWANNTAGSVFYDDLSIALPWLGAPSFSIDFQGPTIGTPGGCFGIPITEGDILIPGPPFFPLLGGGPPPCVAAWGGPGPNPGPDLGLPLWAGAVGHPHGVPGLIEVDALSYGTDWDLNLGVPWAPLWSFSVDEFAWGFPGMPPPSVTSEGMAGANEASADVFLDLMIGPGPYPAPGPPMPDRAIFDGNGLPPWGGPGYSLLEPNPPNVGPFDYGDTLDALDVDEAVGPQYAPFPVYFSLDSFFPDPLEGPPVNSGSAAALGFVGGDVLVTTSPGALPVVYAPAPALGLDQLGGPDSDDLDALILWENGDGVYQPSQQPFDWHGGATDMLLFSVRRGSPIIGAPDSLWNVPIEEGDILCPPVVGGASPFPGIFIPAEMIGLGTMRTGTQNPWTGFADDLDALDVAADCNMNGMPDPDDIFNGFAVDCNSNFVPDACDIATGTSLDCNNNGIPDECEVPAPCLADLNGDCVVNTTDLLMLLGDWGSVGSTCIADVDGDFDVDTADLLALLGAWGSC